MKASDIDSITGYDSVVVHHRSGEWDEMIARLGGGPVQSWAWGELKGRFGWRALRLAAADESAAAQLLIRPFRGLAVAYVPRGPVMAHGSALKSELIGALISVARANQAAFLRIEPDTLDDASDSGPLDADLRVTGFVTSDGTIQPRSSIWVDLTPPLEQVRGAFSTGRKGRIRTAERDGVSVRVGDREGDVELLYRTLAATAQRKGDFGIHSAAY